MPTLCQLVGANNWCGQHRESVLCGSTGTDAGFWGGGGGGGCVK